MIEKREYCNFESLLNSISSHIKKYPNVFSETKMMPAFYVKYMSIIVDKIRKESIENLKELQEKMRSVREKKDAETVQKLSPIVTELQAIQRLQKSMSKTIPMFKQIELYLDGKTSFWEDGDDVLEDEMGEQDEEEESDIDFDNDPPRQNDEEDVEEPNEDRNVEEPKNDEDNNEDVELPKKKKKRHFSIE